MKPVSQLSTESSGTDVQQTSYVTSLCKHTHAHTYLHMVSFGLPLSYPYPCAHITHHMAETHAKSLLKQKVVKSERNQFKSEG